MTIEYKNHKIFAFSDTHGFNDRLQIPKDADILICAGDCCKDCNQWEAIDEEQLRFFDWYARQPAKLRIYVPGNHDVIFDLNPEAAFEMIPSSIVLLEDCGIEFEGISFYGAVCRPWMFTNTENHVPEGVDFLITHGPAEGHLDNGKGCKILKKIINESKPRFHLFGHIHELYYLHTQGNWLKALNDKSMNMGYPKQFQFYSATPSIWADDIKWICPVASWNKRFQKSLDGLGVATWLCLNAEPDARYAIITRGKENEFMKNQKENLFVCKDTGVTEEIADLIIEMFNGIAFY